METQQVRHHVGDRQCKGVIHIGFIAQSRLNNVSFALVPSYTVVPRKSGHPLSPNTQVRFVVVSGYQG